MRAITDSADGRCTWASSAPAPLTVPAYTSSPGCLATGSGSPVMLAWSTSLAPSTTTASAPIRSPGRTRITCPTTRSAAAMVSSVPSSRTRVARSGARSSSARTESAVRAVANASSAPEVAKMTISSAPSKACPMPTAPSAATIISRSTSRVLPRSARSPASAGSHPPAA